MSIPQKDPLLQLVTTCGSLVHELQIIWDEVGESGADRDRMLDELQQECLDVYRRKVDHANIQRAQLRQTIADSEAELAEICSQMGERPVHIRQYEQNVGSLREELQLILPQLEEMRKRKCDRRSQINLVMEQIREMSIELYRTTEHAASRTDVDEGDLSMRRLDDLHRVLQALQKEKSDRQEQVQGHLNTLNCLCLVLGIDFLQTVSPVHPGLCDSNSETSVSDDIIRRLSDAVQNTRVTKIQRMQKLQDLTSSMLELWDLMDTPTEEQQAFQNVTCNIAASEDEITEPNMLSIDSLKKVEEEVCRLEKLKSSKMKELILRKRSELEELCKKTHLVLETDAAGELATEAIESGVVDVTYVLENIELQIGKVKEEALSRKDILEKVEKWMAACEEEQWLEDYNKDENRYNIGRGSHLILKRAEKARALVSKIPGLVEGLMFKTLVWEQENESEFTYDGVRLVSMLEDYTAMREEKEQQRRRQRDQKKLQGQQTVEKDSFLGSKQSPLKPVSVKKTREAWATSSSNKNGSLQTPKTDTAKANGKREHDLLGASLKKHGLIAADPCDSPSVRRPFSSIPSPTPRSRSHSSDMEEADPNIHHRQNEHLPRTKLLSKNLSFPLKNKHVAEEENDDP
uniref:Uncharacterized protein n=1 Tax=Kalanchoe fedtschenkoi TaxID=63787 RepID=A0A7N1A6T1_KALFE